MERTKKGSRQTTFPDLRFCEVIVTRLNRGCKNRDYGKGWFSLVPWCLSID